MRFTPYTPADFLAVRDMLAASFRNYPAPENWLVDRWNMVGCASRLLHGLDEAAWAAGIGLWRDGTGRIAAMANEEEGLGDAFFQFLSPELATPALLEEMFAFAERACVRVRDGRPRLALRIPKPRLAARGPLAGARGFRPSGRSEDLTRRPLGGIRVPVLPEGLRFAAGDEVPPAARARAHQLAFGYSDRRDWVERSPAVFAAMARAPDYRPELDVAIVDRAGEVAAFANVWLDPLNGLGVLEPVGTVRDLHGRGLGKAVVLEALGRAEKLGARSAFVVSDLPFYAALGFEVVARSAIWERAFA